MNEKIRIRLTSYDHTVVNNEIEVLETFEASEVYTLGNRAPIAVVQDPVSFSETGEVLSEFPVFYNPSFESRVF
ncbi:hypothetical protein [Lyngbya sp. PCC 8106]|uniref:hypothetical protein n=1 Tax=Lyngbya sp. (strain PCC 8106) TaxID=313612 RepID=UPI0000EA8CE4|nr:hypothetical protein [Lyngbya sp. PCC 8106]EAW36249.1 hypothetical protein L8106_23006 [Lyngbya sp. PCC 8106]